MKQEGCSERGMYFGKKEYDNAPLMSYEEARPCLPEPIYEADPGAVDCYLFAVKTLFGNTHRPAKGSGFVSNFVDAAFNADIFLWDTAFMTMFCNLLHPYVPGICSLDNFYCKQREDGEITREIVRESGEDFWLWTNRQDKPLYSYFHNHYGFRRLLQLTDLPYEEMYRPDLGRVVEKHPYYTLDSLNHPILAWAEWESYCHTGDAERVALVWEPLFKQFEAMKYHLQHKSGLYVTDWASMDNSTRNAWLGLGVDISCEMVLFARCLLSLLRVLREHGREPADAKARAALLQRQIDTVTEAVNRYLWNEEDGFYYDVNFRMEQSHIKTAAAFWALLSGVAEGQRQERLAAWLNDKATFGRLHRVPVLAADEPGYDPEGGYWRGSVWAPMNAMVVRGLEWCGRYEQAAEIAVNHVEVLARVFEKTGTIWENYPADSIGSGNADNKDFVGWSAIGPILFLIRYAIGLSWDQERKELVWRLPANALEKGEVGCKRYWFAGRSSTLTAKRKGEGTEIRVETKDAFSLRLVYGGREEVYEISGDTCLTMADGEKGADL